MSLAYDYLTTPTVIFNWFNHSETELHKGIAHMTYYRHLLNINFIQLVEHEFIFHVIFITSIIRCVNIILAKVGCKLLLVGFCRMQFSNRIISPSPLRNNHVLFCFVCLWIIFSLRAILAWFLPFCICTCDVGKKYTSRTEPTYNLLVFSLPFLRKKCSYNFIKSNKLIFISSWSLFIFVEVEFNLERYKLWNLSFQNIYWKRVFVVSIQCELFLYSVFRFEARNRRRLRN